MNDRHANRLTEGFLPFVDDDLRARLRGSSKGLEQLDLALARAETAWPEVSLSRQRLWSYLAARVPNDEDFERSLSDWRTEELRLCCGCVDGDERAVSGFYQRYHPIVRATLRRMRLNDDLVQEVEQLLSEQLLVSRPGGRPLIAAYSGTGRLEGWLRIVAGRRAAKVLEREKRHLPVSDDEMAMRLTDDDDLDDHSLVQIREIYRPAFKRAFKEALRSLSPRDGNLLRYRYLDRFSLERIGAIYRVHNSTAHRWIEKVRQQLLQQTRQLLSEQLEISQRDCLTIIRMLKDNFDITLQSFIAEGPGPESR